MRIADFDVGWYCGAMDVPPLVCRFDRERDTSTLNIQTPFTRPCPVIRRFPDSISNNGKSCFCQFLQIFFVEAYAVCRHIVQIECYFTRPHLCKN